MKIKIQITVESDKGQLEVVQEVAHLDRGILRPETLGLTLAEARSILAWDRANSGRAAGSRVYGPTAYLFPLRSRTFLQRSSSYCFSHAVWQVEVGESTALSLPVRVG